MNDILAALATANGPDRALDFKIAFEVRWRPTAGISASSFAEHEAKNDYATAWIAHAPWRLTWDVPRYTESFDAAMTTLPANCDWHLEPDGAWVRWMGKEDVEEVQFVLCGRDGKCTPIAICGAAMKARAAIAAASGAQP